MQHRQRILPLDGVRGLAILWVVMHNSDFIELPHDADLLRHVRHWIPWILDHLLQIGWAGVQLFFVLSGFLITGILLRSRTEQGYLRNFYTRRAFRILPVYYVTLVVILGMVAHFHPPPELAESAHHQFWLWVFLTNWAQPFGASVAGLTHFWSLAVEEQFYFVWPFFVLFVAPRRLLWLSFALAIGAALLRLGLAASGLSLEVLYEFTVCRMDALLFGAMVGIALEDERLTAWLSRHQRLYGWLALVVFLGGGLLTRGYERGVAISETIGQSFLSVAFALLILSLVLPNSEGSALSRVFETRPLRSLGKYSYAMYVLHFPVGKFIGERLLAAVAGPGPYSFTTSLTYALIVLVTAYVLALGSYRVLEGPMMRLRDRTIRDLTTRAPATARVDAAI